MKLRLSFCLFLICQILFGQDLACTILTEQQEPLPYVNVYNADLDYGIVSDLNGMFLLPAEKIELLDSIRLSAIGYESSTLSLADLAGSCQIVLKAINYSIQEVKVTAEKVRYRKRKKGINPGIINGMTGFMTVEETLGYEIGTIIRNEETCYLESLFFRLETLNCDEANYGINIYELNNGQPIRNINREELLMSFGQNDKKKKVELDLKDRRLKVDTDFLVTLEVLSIPPGENTCGGLFVSKVGGQQLLQKDGRTGEWKLDKGPLAIYATMRCER